MLKKVDITDFVLENDKRKSHIQLFYEVFGQPIGDNPIVLVNHALTGNSNVSGEKGWWKNVIDYDHIIDLNKYTVIAFNIPGNEPLYSGITKINFSVGSIYCASSCSNFSFRFTISISCNEKIGASTLMSLSFCCNIFDTFRVLLPSLFVPEIIVYML